MHKTAYTQVATESPTSQSDDNLTFENVSNNTVTASKDYVASKTSMKKRKKWEIFPGRNMFCCDGFIITSQQHGIFYLTCFLIIGTSVLFFAFDCPYLATELSITIPIVGGLMFLFVMVTLLRTSFTDPGIIPRATEQEALDVERQIEIVQPGSGATSYKPPPRTRDLTIQGQLVRLKYCFTCKIFRPPRASHCSVCDNCVERFDHHCPWVGNCVGLRNYRYFYMFLLSLSLLSLFIFSNTVAHLLLISRENGILDAFKKSPASVVEAFVCFFSVWSVIGLTGFHTYLAGSNLTTNEDMKGTYSAKRSEAKNPYSQHSLFQNYCSVICGPVPPSLIDRRGLVQSESGIFQDGDRATNEIEDFEDDEKFNKLEMLSSEDGTSKRTSIAETSLTKEVHIDLNIQDIPISEVKTMNGI